MPHPKLNSPDHRAEAETAVANLVAELQFGLDRSDTESYNRSFAGDVIWGGPYGATVAGYDRLHAIHQRLQSEDVAAGSRYEVVQVIAPAVDVAVAHVRRVSLDPDPSAFSEMAMYVLVKRDGRWWLAAGQNTVVQPGRSATD